MRNTLGCAYLNGWVAILGVQLFALVGMLFSIAAMGDCSFMELDERLFFPPDLDENLPLKVTQTKYVGFLTWQALDGYVLIFINVLLSFLIYLYATCMLKPCNFVTPILIQNLLLLQLRFGCDRSDK